MKKIVFLFILATAFYQYTYGQNTFGIKAGVNVANQDKTYGSPQAPASQKQDTKTFIGYQLGAFYKMHLNNGWMISPEINFSTIGSKTFYVTEEQILHPDGIAHYYNDKTGYAELMTTLQYSTGKLYFGAGPSISFRLFTKITHFENKTYNGPTYRTSDIAANLLGGYKLLKKVDLDIRYSYGLMNMYGDTDWFIAKNHFLNFSILYSIK